MQKPLITIFAALSVSITSACAQSLDTLSFLEGHWRGGDESFGYEEIWTSAEGGVMTAMVRGIREGKLVVLEYLVIDQQDGRPVMRFKHFNADYTNWEGEEDQPITLLLTEIDEGYAVFSASTPDTKVRTVKYVINDQGQLVADVAHLRNGEKNAFTLIFDKIK